MARLNHITAALLLAAACVPAWAAVGAAQSNPPPAQPPAAAGQPGPGDSGPPPNEQQEQQEHQLPVLAITGVEVLRSSQTPPVDVIRVRAVTSTQGWSSPELIPITHGKPSDGVLDLVLVAAPPAEFEPTGFDQIEAILPVDPEHPYKGIRVRSASNAVTLKTLPGNVQAKPPAEDCSKCVGKHFVAKGASAPAGVAAADMVKQEDLPPTLRIVRPTDGIAGLQSDPNRLTLVIGEDGKIVDAAWD